MFQGFGSWLGLEPPASGSRSAAPEDREEDREVNRQPAADHRDGPEAPQEPTGGAGGLGVLIFSLASRASSRISSSVVDTAQSVRRTVEEGRIIDKTFLGDFQKEQEKFVQEKNSRKSEAAVPPWVGYNQEEEIQRQILALSADKRNFLRDPPAGVQFQFSIEEMFPLAEVMLGEDQLLPRMRFDLVPRHVQEEVFWRNYFYRVSLVQQASLTALTSHQEGQRDASHDHLLGADGVRPKTPPIPISGVQTEDGGVSTSPGVSEFVSDAFQSASIDQEDLREGLQQLVLSQGSRPRPHDGAAADGAAADGATADGAAATDGEQELQHHLQDEEGVTPVGTRDHQWDLGGGVLQTGAS
ncbi:synapse-associated protein 1-like isoform X2 [Antennarius striatus]|uniref:synapse-associated protein 1-like isoform X2 n=1 Tax=Antennarius striatus TaxID=241820 RepID=UPI0035B0B3B1